MRRPLIVLLGLGVLAGYGSAFASLHHRRWHGGYEGGCDRWSQRYEAPQPVAAAPAPAPAPVAAPAPAPAAQQQQVIPQIIIVQPQNTPAPTVIVQQPQQLQQPQVEVKKAEPTEAKPKAQE